MINKFIRNFVAKQIAGRSDDGIMITLRDPQKVELLENIMADLLMRNGIDPRAITSEAQLKTILKAITRQEEKVAEAGIRNTRSAKVFDLEGKKYQKDLRSWVVKQLTMIYHHQEAEVVLMTLQRQYNLQKSHYEI